MRIGGYRSLVGDWADSGCRALDDIKASIRELQFYREHIFIPADEAEAKYGSKGETEGVTEDLAQVKI